MEFALTTRWNAGRHTDGEAMLEEILEMGFRRVELGYDLRLDLVPGVRRMVEAGSVRVDSLHNFCPLPVAAPYGHPEIFTLGSKDRRIREQAVHYTEQTIRFAAAIGASTVVTHAGNVEMKRLTPALLEACERGDQFSTRYEKLRMKLQLQREKKGRKQFVSLLRGIEALMPVLEETGVRLAIENLPTWEALPTELEMEELVATFPSGHLRAWHDIGHARIRQNLGFINHERWLERQADYIAGMHIHDVTFPGRDHVMPPQGDIDFSALARFATLDLLRVIEPTPRTPKEEVEAAHRFLQATWGGTAAAAGSTTESFKEPS